MRLPSKIALATLALAIGSSPALARTPQGPPPDQSQGPGQGLDGFGRGGPARHVGPDGPRDGRGERDGGWNRDGRGRSGWGHGGWGYGGRMGMRGRGDGPREFGLARLLDNPEIRQQIGVTADQAAKIRQQESDFRKTEIRNRADLEVKRIDLKDLLSADKPDRAAIDSKLQEISAAQLVLGKSSVDYRLDMRDALTPAQRQKLEQWMKQRRQPGPGGNAGPRGPRGGERGGRGTAPPPPANGQGQTPNP